MGVRSRFVAGVLATAALVLPVAGRAGAAPAGRATRVVVTGRYDAPATAAAVRRAGGTVTADLPVVSGVAATLPAGRLAALRGDPAVRSVTPDAAVHVASVTDSSGGAIPKSVYRDETGATALAAAGLTGRGVRIALIDTGVTEVPDVAGRVVDVSDPGGTPSLFRKPVHCVDLSGEGDCVDRYGHGTFLAGLMVGNGAQSAGLYGGVAPGADLVSLKIAGRDGAADVSKVLAAIQWVVSFHDRYGIKVLNLSLGTNSTDPWWVDPLNLAVEQAWRAGITVVVAAGNLGPGNGSISKPGDDPYVITVGAVDDRETTALADDRLPNFSSRGPTLAGVAKPDVVAPGAKLVSLRLADSYIEQQAGPGVMAGGPYPAYRRGSGTSMATAVTSGVVAQLLQRHPDWTPDRVKYALTSTAWHVVASQDRRAIGAGLINGAAAVDAGPGLANSALGTYSNGTASIDASRGDVHVGACRSSSDCAQCSAGGSCPPIEGDQTAQGRAYDGSQYAKANWDEQSWYTSQWAAPLWDTGWYGNTWLGNTWLGNTWLGNTWLGSTFYGASENDDGYGRPAKGGAWYGAWS